MSTADRKAVTEKAADFLECIYSTLRQNWNSVEKPSLTARQATVQKLRRVGLERHEREGEWRDMRGVGTGERTPPGGGRNCSYTLRKAL